MLFEPQSAGVWRVATEVVGREGSNLPVLSVGCRHSKVREDRDERIVAVPGTLVYGVDEGDWIRVEFEVDDNNKATMRRVEPKRSLEATERMVDLTVLSLNSPKNQAISSWILEWAPRLLVVHFLGPFQDPKWDTMIAEHNAWVNQLIEWQCEADRKFMLFSSPNHPAATSRTVMSSHYSPMQWTSQGFISRKNAKLGIYTNVDEIAWTLQDHKRQVAKQRLPCEPQSPQAGEKVFQGVFSRLHNEGFTQHDLYLQYKEDLTELWKYPTCTEPVEIRSINAITKGIQNWLLGVSVGPPADSVAEVYEDLYETPAVNQIVWLEAWLLGKGLSLGLGDEDTTKGGESSGPQTSRKMSDKVKDARKTGNQRYLVVSDRPAT